MKKFKIYGMVCLMSLSFTVVFAQTAGPSEIYKAGKVLSQTDIANICQYKMSKEMPDLKTVSSVKVNGQELKVGEKLNQGKANMLNNVYKSYLKEKERVEKTNAAKSAKKAKDDAILAKEKKK